jgi:hypothetical protein
MMTPDFNKEKFRELLLHVASRMLGDPSYGSVKLNKVLFFSDYLHYAIFGTPITGAEYVRYPLGPAPRGITTIQQELIDAGDADLAVLQRGTRAQKILFPKREADLSQFSGQEIATVHKVLDVLAERTAVQVSDLSHALSAWQVAREREVIPYSAIFLYDGPVTEEDILSANTVAEDLRAELENAGIISAAA